MRRLSIFEVSAGLLVSPAADQSGLGLAGVPPGYWQQLASAGFDYVWLMGVWQRSEAARAQALAHPDVRRDYDRALPGWTNGDVAASPYAIKQYRIEPRFGDAGTVAEIRRNCRDLGMGLILDFVPNHLARDHDWTVAAPQRFVRATPEVKALAPEIFFAAAPEVDLAYGKDPNFPPWTDTVQLNYFCAETRAAMIAELLAIAAHCDGVRCDMAMLALNDVFERTWGWAAPGARPSVEFWQEAIAEVRQRFPEFLFIAEAYWGLEPQLLELGFDYAYDRALYDLLRHGDAASVRHHLQRIDDRVDAYVHFLENHDEERALTAFGAERGRAAAVAMATMPGMKLIHDGQLEGRRVRVPVQLRRRPDEDRDPHMERFYRRLLTATNCDPMAAWRIEHATPAWSGDVSHAHLLAWSWSYQQQSWLAVINFSAQPAQGRIFWIVSEAGEVELYDVLTDERFVRTAIELRDPGLYVDLPAWASHVFALKQRRM
ncbi:MAG TPA: alpha-amylase family glycosyl hydrolase [Terriglobales bacterium]|nr:alpha-amylase family glycosyl hydrolase [Terriglobales bacterium]